MMLRKFWLCFFVLFLTACAAPVAAPTLGATPSQEHASSTPVISTLTATLAPSDTVSATSFPTASETPEPTEPITETPTRVPLPLTPGPTYDIKKIHTVIPARSAVCPKEDPALVPPFGNHQGASLEDLLHYLNSGGSVDLLLARSDNLLHKENVVDLTGDGVKEIVYGFWNYDVLGCKNGAYEILFHIPYDGTRGNRFREAVDLNQNGIPEVIISQPESRVEVIFIYEWDGSTFQSLIKIQHDPFTTTSYDKEMGGVVDWVSVYFDPYQLVDTNGDGLKEIVLVHNPHGFNATDGYAFYNETIILGWNGENYVNLKPGNYSPPFYRFQAVLMGDMQTLYGNYDYAFASYEQAIFSDKLEWWTEERQTYWAQMYNSGYSDPTPPADAPYLVQDLTERPKLAAYALYRTMILHTFLHKTYAAKTDYSDLQQKFPDGNPGHPYAVMATVFWDSYQSNQKIGEACSKTTAYVQAHQELLEPFGFRGWWSRTYDPADFCPFK